MAKSRRPALFLPQLVAAFWFAFLASSLHGQANNGAGAGKNTVLSTSTKFRRDGRMSGWHFIRSGTFPSCNTKEVTAR